MPSGVYKRDPNKWPRNQRRRATRVYKRRAPPSPVTSALIHFERAMMLMPPPAELTECHLEVLHGIKELRGSGGLDL